MIRSHLLKRIASTDLVSFQVGVTRRCHSFNYASHPSNKPLFPLSRNTQYHPIHIQFETKKIKKKKRKQWIVVNVKRLALRSNTFSRKEREEGNGRNFERDENCRESRDAFERLAAWQRFRFVDDGIFNENRWSLVGQKQAGTT